MKSEQLHESLHQALETDKERDGKSAGGAARAKTSLMMGTAAFLLFTSGCAVSTVEPSERGLKWNMDGLQRESLKDGVYWMAPWNDV